MEHLLGICIGIGLAAACGFRIFVPFLLMSIAAQSGHLSLYPEWQWIGTEYAVIAFGTATLIEIASYYVPWLDNLLDTISTPAAIVAGSVAMASQVSYLSPFLQWSLAIIAGGATAGIVQGGTVLIRSMSTMTTAGLGNSVFSTGELAGSVALTALSIVIPVVGICVLLVLIALLLFNTKKIRFKKNSAQPKLI